MCRYAPNTDNPETIPPVSGLSFESARAVKQCADAQNGIGCRPGILRPAEGARRGAVYRNQIRIGITTYLKFGLFGTVNRVGRLASPKASCISSVWIFRNTSIR